MKQTAVAGKHPDSSSQNMAGKYLSFFLASEEFGIGILKVREIIGMMKITAVPQTPEYVKGVINLRGTIIPIIDLRCKFEMKATDFSERTCIIVVEKEGVSGSFQAGLIVDSVSEVITIGAGEIEPPIVLGEAQQNHYILGIAKLNNGVKMLLDIDHLVNSREIEAIAASL